MFRRILFFLRRIIYAACVFVFVMACLTVLGILLAPGLRGSRHQYVLGFFIWACAALMAVREFRSFKKQ